MGGWGGGGALSSAEVYDIVEGKWCEIASMRTRRQALGVTTLHGKVYAVGGFDGSQNLASVERYDPATDEWIELQSMSVQRRGCAAVACAVSWLDCIRVLNMHIYLIYACVCARVCV